MLDLLKQLIAIPSVTGKEQELACFCEAYLQQYGFQTDRQTVVGDRFNVLAEKGEGSKAFMLYAHLDTVPPDPEWNHDPYRLQQDRDRLYGLGTSDMKGGLAVLLQAVATAQPRDYRLKVALGVDEEAYSQGAYTLTASDWCQDVAGILVPELGDTRPEEHLVIGRRGHFSFELMVQGNKVHGAVADTGKNAIEVASEIVLLLQHFPLQKNPDLGSESLLVRGIRAEENSLSVPAECRLTLSYFPHPDRTQAHILQALKTFILYPITIEPAQRPTPSPQAYALTKEPWIAHIQAIIQRVLGKPLPLCYAPSVADENIFYHALRIPVLALAPIGGNSHRADEWVSLSSMERVLKFYQAILEKPF